MIDPSISLGLAKLGPGVQSFLTENNELATSGPPRVKCGWDEYPAIPRVVRQASGGRANCWNQLHRDDDLFVQPQINTRQNGKVFSTNKIWASEDYTLTQQLTPEVPNPYFLNLCSHGIREVTPA